MHSFARGENLVIVYRTARRVAGVPAEDAWGNTVWNETRANVSGAVVWPTSDVETPQDQERTSMSYTVVLPDDNIMIDAVDRIEWRGKSYEVQGELEQNTNMATGTKANAFKMTRVEG